MTEEITANLKKCAWCNYLTNIKGDISKHQAKHKQEDKEANAKKRAFDAYGAENDLAV